MRSGKTVAAIFISLCGLMHVAAQGRTAANSGIAIIEPDPYDSFYIDSSIIVNDGYTYTTDSLAVIAILKANGWGMPIKDSAYGYIMQLGVDSISTKVNGRIVKLNLENTLGFLQWAAYGARTNPPTYLPPDIGKLTALQILDIIADDLDSLPSAIGNLSHLISLWGDMNHLTKLPSTIDNMEKLADLSLIGNQLTELPSTIGNLTNLRALALRDNNLSWLPAGVGNFTNLVDLSLSRNQLQTLPPEIGNCKNLNYLEIDAAGLTSLPNQIGSCTNLAILMVGKNNLSALPDSIVNLANCSIWVDSNYLCSSIPCPVQSWLDLHVRDNWRIDQHCSMISIPPCSSNGAAFKSARKIRPQSRSGFIAMYDLRGRLIRSSYSCARHSLASGSYIIINIAPQIHSICKSVLP